MESREYNKIVPKYWGQENWMVNNEKYCAKILTVMQNKMCSIHYHKIKDETFIIQSGLIKLQIFDEPNEIVSREYIMAPNDAYRLPKGTIHRFIGVAPLSDILEVSTQHFDADSYRIKDAGDYHGK